VLLTTIRPSSFRGNEIIMADTFASEICGNPSQKTGLTSSSFVNKPQRMSDSSEFFPGLSMVPLWRWPITVKEVGNLGLCESMFKFSSNAWSIASGLDLMRVHFREYLHKSTDILRFFESSL